MSHDRWYALIGITGGNEIIVCRYRLRLAWWTVRIKKFKIWPRKRDSRFVTRFTFSRDVFSIMIWSISWFILPIVINWISITVTSKGFSNRIFWWIEPHEVTSKYFCQNFLNFFSNKVITNLIIFMSPKCIWYSSDKERFFSQWSDVKVPVDFCYPVQQALFAGWFNPTSLC